MTCMTYWRTCRRCAESIALLTLLASSSAAQEVAADLLQHPTIDSWPTYHGDYSGRRHSSLTQITPANVQQLTLAWAFQTNQTQLIKATPILVNGIIYLSAPDNVWAIEARSGRQLWRYTHPANDGVQHRPSRRRRARRSRSTSRRPTRTWSRSTRAPAQCAGTSRSPTPAAASGPPNAPLVIRNHLIVGVSGDFDNLPGILKSFDPATGAPQWTFYSTPPPGTPDSTSGGATGGQMWMTGTYDPELNLLYVGTGNPTPVLNGPARPGDNKWTGSIVALNPDTGRWCGDSRRSPHDTHDWDAAEVPVLVDADFRGEQRKLLLQASRNGYYFVLDRVTGKPADRAVCRCELGDGHRRERPADSESRQGTRARRPSGRARRSRRHQLPLARVRPRHRPVHRERARCVRHLLLQARARAVGWAGADYTVHGRGVLRAIDYQTGQIRWSHDLHGGAGAAGVLTTATGLTFTGDSANNALALRSSDGTTLWHSGIGRVGNSPITYELDGRQYVLFGGGSVLYAFALPQ